MSVAIPGSIKDVDARWLAEATGLKIKTADIGIIGVGVGVASAVYRAKLTGDDCPASVIVKLPALDEAAVSTSTILRMYIREVRFFKSLAKECPVLTPRSYFGAVNEETSQFAMVLEDLAGHRIIDQTIGITIEDARLAGDALAKIHAKWWGRADALAADGTTIPFSDPIYPAVLPVVFAEGWEKVKRELNLSDSILKVGEKFAPQIGNLMTSLMDGVTTLAHGDFRADNMMFTKNNEFVLYDFQLIGTGSGAYDLAYFVTQSLKPEDASKYEGELFERWLEGLRKHGVTDLDRDRLWLQYRGTALFCLVYPVVASRGMDLNEPRSRALVETMNSRFERAFHELDLAKLI
ncbi:MAG: phosphotransferase [Actinomycetota bacterium]